MTIVSNCELLSIVLEDDYGVDPLSGADPTSFLAPVRDSVSVKEVIVPVADQSAFAVQATRKGQAYGDYTEFSFSIPLTGKGGAAGSPPEYSAILQALGLVETIDPGVDVQYDPNGGAVNASAETSFTLVYYEFDDENDDTAYEHRITGCRANGRVVLNQGQAAILEVTGAGLYSSPPTDTTAAPTTPTDYQAAANSNFLIVQGMTNTIGGTTACFTSCTIDLANQIAYERCATGAAAVTEVYLHRSGNPPTINYTLRADATTIETWVGALEDATTYALAITLGDGTDTLEITAPVYQPTGWTPNRGEGRKNITLEGQLHGDFGNSTGADFIKLTYT